jgi:hypothetical protein
LERFYNWDYIFFLQDIIEMGEKQPNITIGVIVSVAIVILTVFFRLLLGGKKPAVCFYASHHNCISPKSIFMVRD